SRDRLHRSPSQKRIAAYATDSNCNLNRVGRSFWRWAGSRRRARFGSALAKHWPLSRRTDTRGLRCAVTAERFLYGPGERRRFQIDLLRANLETDFRLTTKRVDRGR